MIRWAAINGMLDYLDRGGPQTQMHLHHARIDHI